LPPILIPPSLRDFIIDFDSPLLAKERETPIGSSHSVTVLTPTKVRPTHQDVEHALTNRALERQGEELHQTTQAYISY
jgi:hypothetical protein